MFRRNGLKAQKFTRSEKLKTVFQKNAVPAGGAGKRTLKVLTKSRKYLRSADTLRNWGRWQGKRYASACLRSHEQPRSPEGKSFWRQNRLRGEELAEV